MLNEDIVLVTGASGFLGKYVCRELTKAWSVVGTFHRHEFVLPDVIAQRVDLTSFDHVRDVLHHYEPAAVVHVAAERRPDFCEQNPEAAHRVNVTATENLLRAAAESQPTPHFIYISTDLVFKGTKSFYREEDEPRPLNVYGQTKLESERLVLRASPANLVFRVAILSGLSDPEGGGERSSIENLLLRMLRGERVRLNRDEFRTPIDVNDVAAAIRAALARRELNDIFHLAGPERLSRLEMGKRMCEVFGLPRELIETITMHEMNYLAPRPADCSLSIEKAQAAFQFQPRDFQTSLREIKQQLETRSNW